MINNMTDSEKRESVKKDYDLIASQYSRDFGNYIEDLDVYHEFEKYLDKDSTILDLGAGSGRTYSYFKEKGYKYIGLDFSQKMQEYAYLLHGNFSYINDDMVNLKDYFSSNSIDAIFAVYSLFHLPNNDLKNLFANAYDVLKDNGIFLFTYQVGLGEEMTDEPYLEDKGKNVVYMNYQTDEEIKNYLEQFSFKLVFKKEKIETSGTAINSNNVTTVFMIVKK